MIKDACLTIGAFDGIHLGHQEVIKHLVKEAASRGGTSLLLTFDPHPLKIIAPQKSPLLLTSLKKKEEIISKLGVEKMIILPFNVELAGMSGQDFVREILLPLKIKKIFVGRNYRFGQKRKGDVHLLWEMGKEYGFEAEGVSPLRTEDGGVISSTRIRESLAEGEIEQAKRLLGRPFSRRGRVVSGEGRGRATGYPTANLEWDKDLLLPKNGAYAVYAMVGKEKILGMANVGRRPTFKKKGLSLEVHLFGFEGNVYGQEIEIIFVKWMREERSFESRSKIAAQLVQDEALARKILVAKDKEI